MIVDLHMHSTASDGSFSPEALMQRVHAAGVDLVALTDHDCIDGQAEAAATARRLGVRWVSGVEMSAQWFGHTLHILGYGFDLDAPAMVDALAAVREGRWSRARQISERLEGKRMPGAFDGAVAVQQAAGGDASQPPGRPHFAEWMVQAGHVRDHGEAFRKWLGAGKLGDIRQHWPTVAEVVSQIRAAGGLAVIAHPWHYGLTRSKLRALLREFGAAGGRGIEVVNGKQPADQVAYLGKLSVEFGFLASCGSDFHSPDSPWTRLGSMTAMPADCDPVWEDRVFCG